MFIYYYFLGIAAVLGLLVGSFLNVVIHRLPLGESVVRPRSRCPSCGNAIGWYDNIPVLSWLILRGRCRRCATPISARYALVELLTCVVSVAVFWQTVPGIDVHHLAPTLGAAGEVWGAPSTPSWVQLLTWLFYFTFFAGMIAVFFIDLRHYIVPNEITFVLLPLGLAGCTGLWFLGAEVPHPLQALAGAVAGGGVLLVVGLAGSWIFRKEAMGMGDVKLLATIGAFLGAWPTLLVVVMLSAVGGSLIGIALRLAGRAQHGVPPDPRDESEAGTEAEAEAEAESESETESVAETEEGPPVGYYIPFGPFLVAAAFIHFLAGDLLIGLYTASIF